MKRPHSVDSWFPVSSAGEDHLRFPTDFATLADGGLSAAVSARPAPAVVAVALSAGGLTPLTHVLSALPRDFQGAIVIACHTSAGSTLPPVLQKHCRLMVKYAESGETIREGVAYVGPPLRHIIVNADRTLMVADRQRIRFARPSADWLFETVAATYGDTAIAIVLSGCQRDGARGVVRIRAANGIVIAQEPSSCAASDMPEAAIFTRSVTVVLPPARIAPAIVERLRALNLARASREFEQPFDARTFPALA